MKSINLTLKEAENDWKTQVRQDFPLRSDTAVIKTNNGPRDWTFSTDLRNIFVDIGNDESLQRKFEEIVTKYWDGKPNELVKETINYLLHHELYHPIEAPFSIEGKDNDNKQIHQAIRRGVLKAEPDLSPLEQMIKVQSSQNGVKDFILDNRLYIDNSEKNYFQKDIIPVWDVLELQESPKKANFYTITRFMYGILYGPESTHDFFAEKATKKGVKVAEKALSTLLDKPVKLSSSLLKKAKDYFLGLDKSDYTRDIRNVFSGDNRYDGIQKIMSVLGPFIESNMPQGRPMQSEGSETSPQNIMQDLLDDMTPEEQQQFVQGLAEDSGELENMASQMPSLSDLSEDKKPSSMEEMKNLDLLAIHEYYKRNHPSVKIVGGSRVGQDVVVGKKEYWNLKNTSILTQDQLSRINLSRIDLLQRKTKLPWLIDLGNGTYKLNEYEIKEKELKDIVYRDSNIDVPDVVEFYLDSSGSMFDNDFKINDGSRWDMLSNVVYGFIDALYQGSKTVGKKTKIRFHNFADKQVSSESIDVNKFLQGDIDTLKTLFRPNNGYRVEDINIEENYDGQQRAYVVVTDGELVISGRSQREAKKMQSLAQSQTNNVVLFEIGGTYSLGEAIKNDTNIVYHQVHDKDNMLQAGVDVLLSKYTK